ncbi:MAG: aminotransferase class I/II-fold pyridoxal phosphate-dependent enzyme [Deltaproteobacteria bacterium]|nr:aminotransferase class I/II-fold pyridoxal phosphate-dependent enzyme [Deltaproteobacteria bacterium]
MKSLRRDCGIGTLVIHSGEGENPHNAHITPIYQTSTYSFPDVQTAAAIGKGEQSGHIYGRYGSPNTEQVAGKIALLEGLDLARSKPHVEMSDLVACRMFSSGMAAVSSAILGRVKAGETLVAQRSLYGSTFAFLGDMAPRLGIKVVWVEDVSSTGWEKALADHPEARMVFLETPANPTMIVLDMDMVAGIAHRKDCWIMVDNTFATPYCQRPLTFGADVVIHSTTKYISGHGLIVGGAVVSPHIDFIEKDLKAVIKVFGGSPSPFDAWLTNIGLKTFEVRMERHCRNAMAVAEFLSAHPKVDSVYYPGLPQDPGHDIAKGQMKAYGGMVSFELKDGFKAGEAMMNHVQMTTLAVSLGNVDSLIEHPASMTHRNVPREVREEMGIRDGLVRLSVGIEDIEDIIGDLGQALDVV